MSQTCRLVVSSRLSTWNRIKWVNHTLPYLKSFLLYSIYSHLLFTLTIVNPAGHRCCWHHRWSATQLQKLGFHLKVKTEPTHYREKKNCTFAGLCQQNWLLQELFNPALKSRRNQIRWRRWFRNKGGGWGVERLKQKPKRVCVCVCLGGLPFHLNPPLKADCLHFFRPPAVKCTPAGPNTFIQRFATPPPPKKKWQGWS